MCFSTVLGDPCERANQPPKGSNPQVENHGTKHIQTPVLELGYMLRSIDTESLKAFFPIIDVRFLR